MTNIDAQIAWGKLDQPTFDRFVEALILRWHADTSPGAHPQAIDGRGGDGGVDIDVHSDGKLTHIYQLKYFPQGFSGGWAKSRKPQIKNSFEKAMLLKPENWILIVPRNPIQGERDFVHSLKKGNKAKIKIFGQSDLDNLMARYPDIQQWAVREPLKDALRSIHLEQRLLSQPSDLEDALQNLHQMADSRSPHWRVDFSVSNGTVTETFVPKHPLAHEKEPIGIESLKISIPKEEVDLTKRAEKLIRFGDKDDLTFESRHIEEFNVQAPAWSRLASIGKISGFKLGPTERPHKSATIEFEVLADDETLIRTYPGSTTYFGTGTNGHTLQASLRGGIQIVMYLPNEIDDNGRDSSFSITHSPVGLPSSDAQIGLCFTKDMNSAFQVRVTLNGDHLTSFVPNSHPSHEVTDDSRTYTRNLIEDLAVIENKLGVIFPVPESVSLRERLEVRIARLLLDGKVIFHPFVESFHGTLASDVEPETIEQLETGVSILVDNYDLKMRILNRKVSLGPARFHVSHALAEDFASLTEAIGQDSSEGIPFKVKTAPGKGVKVFLLTGLRSTDTDLVVTPWGLPGVSEHHELKGTTPPPPTPLS